MDVDDDDFGSPMPPFAEMDDVSDNHAVLNGGSNMLSQQSSNSPLGGLEENGHARDTEFGGPSNLLLHSCVPSSLGVNDKVCGNQSNGFHTSAVETTLKLTSREPRNQHQSNANTDDAEEKFGRSSDSSQSDFFPKISDGSERKYRSDRYLTPGTNVRNSISEVPNERSDDTYIAAVPSKNVSNSVGGSCAINDATRTACNHCNHLDPSSTFASALAKISMLNQLSTSGEDSGLGGGGAGSHEMAEIMHNYVRALHSSPAFQHFIQYRSTTATAPGAGLFLRDDQQQQPSNGARSHNQYSTPAELCGTTSSAVGGSSSSKALSPRFLHESGLCYHLFNQWSENEQILYVQFLLDQMQHSAQSRVNMYLRPKLQRDFISLLPKLGMQHIAESILEKLDDLDLRAAEKVSPEWYRAIADGMQWKKLIERNVVRDTMWRGLGERRGWMRHLFKRLAALYPAQALAPLLSNDYFRALYPDILKDIRRLEDNWRSGKHILQRINCRSENSKGVYCLQYDEDKIVSGLRDNTIKIWDKKTLQLRSTLKGHNGSVLCLQYDDRIIISGSSDATVRVWDVNTGEQLAYLLHHCEAVLHLRFGFGIMVTCSKDRSIAVWDMTSSRDINFRRNLVGHRAAVNVVDFDEKYIVSASGDRSIKVWNTQTCELVRNLAGHRRGIACLQYRDKLVVSGSSDYTIRIWDIELGHCLRVLEGHEELVRCIRFDNKRIVSGAYDGKIKVWDLEAALDVRRSAASLCIQTLVEHTGRVFRLQFDEFQIVSSSHDDTILIWDFFNIRNSAATAAGVVQQHIVGGGGPPDGNNNAGAGGGNQQHFQYYHHNLGVAGVGHGGAGFQPPPSGGGGGGGNSGFATDSDSSKTIQPPASDVEMSDSNSVCRLLPVSYAENVSRSQGDAAQTLLPACSLQRQQKPGEAGGVFSTTNNNSSSSSSASTPLCATLSYSALPNSSGHRQKAKSASCSSSARVVAGVESVSNSVENIQPKLSQLDLTTAALNRQHYQLMLAHQQGADNNNNNRPATSVASHVGAGNNNPRMLYASGLSHVSSPALLESSDNVANDSFSFDAEFELEEPPVGSPLSTGAVLCDGRTNDLATRAGFAASNLSAPDHAPSKTRAAGTFHTVSSTGSLTATGWPESAAARDAHAASAGSSGLYVRHKAKRTYAPSRARAVDLLAEMRSVAADAKVLQQMPSTLHATGSPVGFASAVNTPDVKKPYVIDSGRQFATIADGISSRSPTIAEALSEEALNSHSNDATAAVV